MAESEARTSRLMLGSWHEEHACGRNLCMVEADRYVLAVVVYMWQVNSCILLNSCL